MGILPPCNIDKKNNVKQIIVKNMLFGTIIDFSGVCRSGTGNSCSY